MSDSQHFSALAEQRALAIWERYRVPARGENWPGAEPSLQRIAVGEPDETGYQLHRFEGDPMDPTLRLRWLAVLLDFPLCHPRWNQPTVFMVESAKALRQGRPPGLMNLARYANHWDALGFSPELYALLRIELARLDLLDIASPERLAALQLDGKLGFNGDRNLDPNDWAAIPALLSRVRPSVAVRQFVRGDQSA